MSGSGRAGAQDGEDGEGVRGEDGVRVAVAGGLALWVLVVAGLTYGVVQTLAKVAQLFS